MFNSRRSRDRARGRGRGFRSCGQVEHGAVDVLHQTDVAVEDEQRHREQEREHQPGPAVAMLPST
ncbi:MAG TPA: hypothetical protein VGA41_06205 [Candidatus Dormibacteraeota bacterium]